MENKLPKGWKYPLLGEVIKITSGNSKLTKKNYMPNAVYTAFSGTGPDGKTDFFEHEGEAIILSAVGARCGKCFKTEGRWTAIANTSIIRLIKEDKNIYRYLFYMFNNENFWPRGGTGQPFVKIGVAQKELRIPFPPIDEQKRIADKLDVLLVKVKDCQTRLDKILLILKRFRQSVLTAACSGSLTADWRERNQNSECIESVIETIRQRRETSAVSVAQKEKLQQIYKYSEINDSGELPGNWRYIALKKLCSSFDYGTSVKSRLTGKVPVLRMGNIQDGEIDWTDLVYTSDDDEIQKYLLKHNTVLFNRTNSPELVGKTAIYRGEYRAIFAGYLIRINPFAELDPEYLNLCLNANYAKEFCLSVKTDGVSQSNINAQKLGVFEVPLCLIDEQKEIVRIVKALFTLVNKIETRYTKTQVQVNKLTQSILAKAFRGELVKQDSNE